MNYTLDRIARDLGNEIESELQRSGILCRVFTRSKTESSIAKKILFKDYAKSIPKKLMQDIIGVRIAFYFADDLPIVYKYIKSKISYLSETIDETEETVFKPSRTNLIFKFDEVKAQEITDLAVSKFKYIDTTYEVQLRTILSEGWHEVDHDLRYKCQEDWEGYSDLARTFNGVYASLVTNDWSILTIFEQLAYRNYKDKNWPAMLRNRFRIRFREEPLSKDIIEIFDKDSELVKNLFRIDRGLFLEKILLDGIKVPLTFSNVVYILNLYFLKNESIRQITPEFIIESKHVEAVQKGNSF